MSHTTQFPTSVLLMLPSDTHKEGTPSNTGASFHLNGAQRSPMSPWVQDNSPLINFGQPEMSNTSSTTSSLQSTSQFEFEDLPTWTLHPDGSSRLTSPTGISDDEGDNLQVKNNSDIDEEPRKRQKTQTGSTNGNGQIKISNILLTKSRHKRPILVDGRSRQLWPTRQQNFDTSTALAVGSADARTMRLSISNKRSVSPVGNTQKKAEPNSTTSISSYIQTEKSNHSSTNSLNLGTREEPPRKTRGLALRPINSSSGANLKKSQARKANQGELELWTNADVAQIRFGKPVLDEVEEENAKRNVSHVLTCLMEKEGEGSNEDVARNEKTTSNSAQNRVAIPDLSIYTRCDDLVEEIFGPDSRTLFKPKKGLVKQKKSLEKSRASSNTVETPSEVVPNIQPMDGLKVAVTSDIEREQVENTLKKYCPSSDKDKDQEDEETRHDANLLQVPLPQLEGWSITLRSLIKGKKKFQHQDLINIKNTLQEIYNNRENISATCSLAQEVYEVSQLEVHDVPNKDELGLRTLARKSTRHWGIRKQRDA